MTHRKKAISPIILLLVALLCFSQESIPEESDEFKVKKLSDAPLEYYPEPWTRSENEWLEKTLEQRLFEQIKPPETWVVLSVIAGIAIMFVLIYYFVPRT